MRLAKGKYYDGITATSHLVEIHHTGSSLHFFNSDHTLNAEWPLDKIHVIQEYHHPQPAKLELREASEARLFIESKEDWESLKNHLPKSAFQTFSLSFSAQALTLYGLASLIILAGIFYLIPRGLESLAYVVPTEWENQLGDYVVKTVVNDPVCVDGDGLAALDQLTTRITAQTTRNVKYDVHVIHDDRTLNALAAPGGKIMLFSAVLKQADTPEEVAGILAHEIAHNELAHPTRAIMRDMGLSLTLSMIFGGGMAGDAAHLVKLLNELSYSREKETEADILGQSILYKANIDPASMTLFFERVKRKEINFEGFQALEYFSTHPSTEDRITRLESAEFDRSKSFEPILSGKEWQDLKEICTKKKTYGSK